MKVYRMVKDKGAKKKRSLRRRGGSTGMGFGAGLQTVRRDFLEKALAGNFFVDFAMTTLLYRFSIDIAVKNRVVEKERN